MIFVDTNYFLRFLLAENVPQHQIAKNLFLEAAEGKIKLFTSVIVIFEIYWVLTSFYRKNKKQIARLLKQIFALAFLEIEGKYIAEKAVKLYESTSLDLEDAFNFSFAKFKKAQKFATFDEKLTKMFSRI